MPRYVLVHGAFHGAWCWELVAPALQAQGHTVTAIDLPGCGADETPAGEVTLESCAERVVTELRDGEPAVLVAHSMGGVVATQAAALAPEAVDRLVFVCAFMPRDGESLRELANLPEGADDLIQASMVVEPPVAILRPDDARAACYGTCSPERAAQAAERVGPQPLAPLGTPVSIGDALDGVDRHYVLTTQDRAVPPALQRRMIRENPCREVAELATDHSPFLSAPDELTALLHRFARD